MSNMSKVYTYMSKMFPHCYLNKSSSSSKLFILIIIIIVILSSTMMMWARRRYLRVDALSVSKGRHTHVPLFVVMTTMIMIMIIINMINNVIITPIVINAEGCVNPLLSFAWLPLQPVAQSYIYCTTDLKLVVTSVPIVTSVAQELHL